MNITPKLGKYKVRHPSIFITEEMEERGWGLDELAWHMSECKTAYDFGIWRLALDLYMEIGPTDSNLRLNPEAFARAFDVKPEFFRNLENAWLEGERQ